jgi:hypothetical protein
VQLPFKEDFREVFPHTVSTYYLHVHFFLKCGTTIEWRGTVRISYARLFLNLAIVTAKFTVGLVDFQVV